ncbi:hypothetical protein HZS55_01795 [Halosimplex rubrum]|uniref:Uncharacterized protein n=1 Tax=Halosimplex rubrum TaxID=869889 RepID=A0A7D5TJP1_9EURY|nr:hypothetical protein [Halosimplex rubrum]QLH76112.1 hypothetical protein HZS55_01795 [Halosimplex rubrum]
MTRSAVQLYALRDVDRPFTEVLELVADAGFDNDSEWLIYEYEGANR